MRNIHEVEVAAKTGQNYNALTEEETKRFSFDLSNYCRDCGECMPCPENINIPAVMRFHDFAEIYGLSSWAGTLYGGLEVKADRCTGCGECEPKCPYQLPIQNKLQKAARDLSR
ncbi:MAG: 4Fe-4S dicluster domain-containing protein [Candidatus Bathyarchaeia archaeon]|jgi:predicted aldo/keto reductase-like oxidoreductase